MKTLKHNEALTEDLGTTSWAEGTAQFTRASDAGAGAEPASAWGEMIDLLLAWLRDPRRAIDDDYEAPSRAAITSALELAREWRSAPTVSATRMGPTGDGGIEFEWRRDREFHDVEVERDGSAEYRVFVDCKLVGRSRLF